MDEHSSRDRRVRRFTVIDGLLGRSSTASRLTSSAPQPKLRQQTSGRRRSSRSTKRHARRNDLGLPDLRSASPSSVRSAPGGGFEEVATVVTPSHRVRVSSLGSVSADGDHSPTRYSSDDSTSPLPRLGHLRASYRQRRTSSPLRPRGRAGSTASPAPGHDTASLQRRASDLRLVLNAISPRKQSSGAGAGFGRDGARDPPAPGAGDSPILAPLHVASSPAASFRSLQSTRRMLAMPSNGRHDAIATHASLARLEAAALRCRCAAYLAAWQVCLGSIAIAGYGSWHSTNCLIALVTQDVCRRAASDDAAAIQVQRVRRQARCCVVCMLANALTRLPLCVCVCVCLGVCVCAFVVATGGVFDHSSYEGGLLERCWWIGGKSPRPPANG